MIIYLRKQYEKLKRQTRECKQLMNKDNNQD